MNFKEPAIFLATSMTAQQLRDSFLALPAFLPLTVCPGYLAGWLLNLHGFRTRSIVERLFWSVPASAGVSTIFAYLIGKVFGLDAAIHLFELIALGALALPVFEWLSLRRSGRHWFAGWKPLGGRVLLLALGFATLIVGTLVDLQRGEQLFLSVPVADQAYRISWTETILRTGIAPTNPLYLFQHAAPMRNYYFWYVLCAMVAKGAHLSVRGVFNASSVWAGFVLAAIAGLFLKYFLAVGPRLRRQFVLAIGLFCVTGLDICVILWNVFFLHKPPSPDLEWWSKDPVISWINTVLWAPHHVVAVACCLFAFLLAWLARDQPNRQRALSVVIASASLASAFGLSVYVAFAFFLLMAAWALWQIFLERAFVPSFFLAVSGVGAAGLLVPFLRELMHTSSGMEGGKAFGFAVREMIPPQGLLAAPLMRSLSISHPTGALNLAKFILLPPGYVLELGFLLLVLLVFAVPALRDRRPLNPAQRSLVFLSVATLILTTFVRSWVLTLNDFGFRSVLFLQFALALLGSEMLSDWQLALKLDSPTFRKGPFNPPQWLRSLASLTLMLGIFSAVYQVLMLRFTLPLAEWAHDPEAFRLSHNAYISASGYDHMNATIPRGATVQFNPDPPTVFWSYADLLGVNHQIAINSPHGLCGSELGGDPAGCASMGAEVTPLFRSATAEQARAVCSRYQVEYLVTRVYDPAWKDPQSWVWALPAAVADPEFRVLNCTLSTAKADPDYVHPEISARGSK